MVVICYETVVPVHAPWHYIILIANIVAPGLGTFISSFVHKNEKCSGLAWLVAFAQFITAWLLIGYVWSIWQGAKIYYATKEDLLQMEREGIDAAGREGQDGPENSSYVPPSVEGTQNEGDGEQQKVNINWENKSDIFPFTYDS